MSEIYSFAIPKAHAHFNSRGGLSVRLFYPKNPIVEAKRLAEQPEFGIGVLDKLMTDGDAYIATPDAPIKPAAGGMLYMFDDGAVLFHKRNEKAPTHPLCHSAASGYTNSREGAYSAQGVLDTCLREGVEEQLLFTPDGRCMYVPRGGEEYAQAQAKKLGLDPEIKTKPIDIEFLPGKDKLTVFDGETTDIIFEVKNVLIEAVWATQTSLSALRIAKLPMSSTDVVPISAECVPDGKGGYIHFNNESFVAFPGDLDNVNWGDALDLGNIRVYENRFEQTANGRVPKPKLMTILDYPLPFRINDIGSDTAVVSNYPHPQVFCPEDLLCRCLDELDVSGYKGRWMEIERGKENARAQWLRQKK